MSIYRALLRVYPRRFREEYGQDMVLLLAAQMRDESRVRVWFRALIDLVITAPALHLEARMRRPAGGALTYAFAALSISASVFATTGHGDLGRFAAGVLVAVVAAVLTIASWIRTRPIVAHGGSPAWWHVALAGVGIFAGVILVGGMFDDLPEGAWLPMVLAGLLGIVTVIFGLILGVARLVTHR